MEVRGTNSLWVWTAENYIAFRCPYSLVMQIPNIIKLQHLNYTLQPGSIQTETLPEFPSVEQKKSSNKINTIVYKKNTTPMKIINTCVRWGWLPAKSITALLLFLNTRKNNSLAFLIYQV